MMVIENKYEIGQIVFLITDEEQCARLITGITIAPRGLTYRLCYGVTETWHYEMEISDEKSLVTR